MSSGSGRRGESSGSSGSSSSSRSRSRTTGRARAARSAETPGDQILPGQPGGEEIEESAGGRRRGEEKDDSGGEKSTPSRTSSDEDGSPSEEEEGTSSYKKFEKMTPKEVQTLSLRPRTEFGQEGRKIPLYANYFCFNIKGDSVNGSTTGGFKGYLYSVRPRKGKKPTAPASGGRAPEEPKFSRDATREIFWQFVTDKTEFFGNPFKIIFDGQYAMFCLEPLGDLYEGPIELEKRFYLHCEQREVLCSMTVQLVAVKTVNPEASVRMGALSETDRSPLQVLDWLIQQGKTYPLQGLVEWSSSFVASGRSIFKIPSPKGDLPSLGFGTEAWVGYYSAASVGWLGDPVSPTVSSKNWKTVFNIDVSNSAFYRRELLFGELCCGYINEAFGRSYYLQDIRPDSSFQRPEYEAVAKQFKNKLRLEYETKNRQGVMMKQTGIFRGFGLPPEEQKFTRRVTTNGNGNGENGGETEVEDTVFNYFAEKGQNVRFYGFCTVKVGRPQRRRGKEIGYPMVPLEFLKVSYPQKVVGKLTEGQTAAMIRSAAKPAPNRRATIQELVEGSFFQKDPWLSEFNCSLDLKMLETYGRVLDPPDIIYNRGRVVRPMSGVWKIQGSMFYRPIEMNAYAVIYFSEKFARVSLTERDREYGDILKFCRSISNELINLGCVVNCQEPVEVESCGRLDDLPLLIRKIHGRFPELDLLFVLLPRFGHQAYPVTKRIAEIEVGVMTQCALWRTVTGIKPMTAQNICLKICMKLGGTVNLIKPPANSPTAKLLSGTTLIFGIDVYHPGAEFGGDARSKVPSIASIVANEDVDYTSWVPSIRVQKRQREHVVYISGAVTERLIAFYRKTGVRPDRIVVYRDGVSEGQFRTPPITYIVAQKRHHTRLFCKDRRDESGKAGNIPPGTTVDTHICHPIEYDFYQCSHQGIQGTSRPIHYYVLLDDSGYTADALQGMTNCLCYLFGRCTRSVSLPAPVYFADLSCTRARHHLGEEMIGSTATSDSTDREKKLEKTKKSSTGSDSGESSASSPTATSAKESGTAESGDPLALAEGMRSLKLREVLSEDSEADRG